MNKHCWISSSLVWAICFAVPLRAYAATLGIVDDPTVRQTEYELIGGNRLSVAGVKLGEVWNPMKPYETTRLNSCFSVEVEEGTGGSNSEVQSEFQTLKSFMFSEEVVGKKSNAGFSGAGEAESMSQPSAAKAKTGSGTNEKPSTASASKVSATALEAAKVMAPWRASASQEKTKDTIKRLTREKRSGVFTVFLNADHINPDEVLEVSLTSRGEARRQEYLDGKLAASELLDACGPFMAITAARSTTIEINYFIETSDQTRFNSVQETVSTKGSAGKGPLTARIGNSKNVRRTLKEIDSSIDVSADYRFYGKPDKSTPLLTALAGGEDPLMNIQSIVETFRETSWKIEKDSAPVTKLVVVSTADFFELSGDKKRLLIEASDRYVQADILRTKMITAQLELQDNEALIATIADQLSSYEQYDDSVEELAVDYAQLVEIQSEQTDERIAALVKECVSGEGPCEVSQENPSLAKDRLKDLNLSYVDGARFLLHYGLSCWDHQPSKILKRGGGYLVLRGLKFSPLIDSIQLVDLNYGNQVVASYTNRQIGLAPEPTRRLILDGKEVDWNQDLIVLDSMRWSKDGDTQSDSHNWSVKASEASSYWRSRTTSVLKQAVEQDARALRDNPNSASEIKLGLQVIDLEGNARLMLNDLGEPYQVPVGERDMLINIENIRASHSAKGGAGCDFPGNPLI